ncbi:MAG: DUF2157 domain-containing protein [Nocardioidaceae bacterium]
MTDDLTTPAARPVAPGQLAWLEGELAAWRSAGVVDDAQAQAIRGRYVASRRFSLTRLLLFVGGAFIGVGLLWLVASNLDSMSPLIRFVVVTALWLGAVAAAELLAERRAHRAVDTDGASPAVGAVRLIAVLAFGAVVFQAAQSLQVPAYEPALVGVWGLGALLYAYAVGGTAALLVAIAISTGWYVWEVFAAAEDGMGFVLPLLLAAAVASAVAVAHAGRWRPAFAVSWREASALLALVALFTAAFPYVDLDRFVWSVPVSLGIVAAVASVAASVVLATGRARLEALAPLVVAVAGVLLVLWEPPEPVGGVVEAEGYLHAFVSVTVYVVAAGWYAVLGVLRDSTRLTVVATAALVLFTTVQSFAVFAPIITGATLFLVLGVVLLGSGFLFDRGRRHLVANLEGASA